MPAGDALGGELLPELAERVAQLLERQRARESAADRAAVEDATIVSGT